MLTVTLSGGNYGGAVVTDWPENESTYIITDEQGLGWVYDNSKTPSLTFAVHSGYVNP